MADSFLTRLDRPALEKLCEDTGSIDALNLVNFSNVACYRWYGLLLSPLVLLRGGRPVYVGKHEKSLYGEKTFDELVIIRYPDLRTFTSILTGRYYSLLNRLRERGVRYFEFSFTKPIRESSTLWQKGLRLVIRFNFKDGTYGNILDRLTNILGKYHVIQLYASRRIGVIPIKGTVEAADPNPGEYEGMAVFSILKDTVDELELEKSTLIGLEAVTTGLAIDIYRSLSVWEAMPWS
jgi:uncharacterized protein (DUF1330 family)